MFKINLSYFPSKARLNFRWIFKEFDLKSNMKGFFENFLALSVKKLKKVLMILPSITGRGRAFLAESCRYMPCLAIRRWNFHAKVANPKVNSQKVYHDDRSTLVGECYKLPRECQTSLRGAITNLPWECQMSLQGAITKLPRECQRKSLQGVINLSKDNNDPTSSKAPIKVEPCSNELSNKCNPCNEKHRHSRLCVKDAKCRMREREPSQIKMNYY